MPLIVVNQQTANVQQEETPVEQVNKPLRERAIVQRRNPSDPVLVVNGKEKKIGKKSQYLLDMMIIEE
jgi:hypothetical protein